MRLLSRRTTTSAIVAAGLATLVFTSSAAASTDPCPSDPFEAAQATSADTVYYWNDVLVDVFSDQGGPPAPLARAAAMMNVAIYDVMNSVYFSELEQLATQTPDDETCGWEPYVVLADAEPGVDADLAAGVAAHKILFETLGQQATLINSRFAERYSSLGYVPDAFELGTFVADAVLAERANDGSSDNTPYLPASSTPGAWRPTLPTCDAATPNWGLVTPFTMATGSQFRPSLPGGYTNYADLLASTTYGDQVDEVQHLGTADSGSTSRTADQEEAAWFWANDLDGTYKPPGQLIEHTKLVAQTQPAAQTSGAPEDFGLVWSQQGVRVSRLFAQVSLAMADAAIAAWDAKYLTPIDLWRPVHAIRGAATDGNPNTHVDATWDPLSADTSGNHFSPCFPAWISGHATFGGAWAEVMDDEFSAVQANYPFPLTLTTDDPHSFLGYSGGEEVHVQRSFDSFDEAAEENAMSRLWLGVHYRWDAEDGLDTGAAVGNHVTSNFLTFSQTCAAWSCAEPID